VSHRQRISSGFRYESTIGFSRAGTVGMLDPGWKVEIDADAVMD
jgi:hypothetical protein